MRQGLFFRATLFGLLVGICVGILQAQEPAREWTDAEGRKVKAQLAGFVDADTVILKLESGQSVNFPIAKLSGNDATYARERFSAGTPSGTDPGAATVDWTKPKLSEEYVIRGMKRETVPGYISVKSGWEYQLRCIEARLEYKGPKDVSEATVKAYYFNRNGQEIERFEKVPRRQNDAGVYVTMPEFFPKGDTIEVYYPITDFHEKSDLATVVVVFGSGDQFSAEALPTMSFEKLDFPEKRHLFPDWKPATSSTSTTSTPAEVELEIRRVRKEKHRFSVYFDGDYQDGKTVVAAEVRVNGQVTPGDGRVTLHAYDDTGKRIVTRTRPSTVEIGNETYVGVPKIANNDWVPVFFALDGDLSKEPPTYVLVFEYGGKTTAAATSSKGATLESLDFPEKDAMAK